jgi:hypothetical protein
MINSDYYKYTPIQEPVGLRKYNSATHYGQVEGLYDIGHCTNRLSVIFSENNIIRLVRIFAPYEVQLKRGLTVRLFQYGRIVIV